MKNLSALKEPHVGWITLDDKLINGEEHLDYLYELYPEEIHHFRNSNNFDFDLLYNLAFDSGLIRTYLSIENDKTWGCLQGNNEERIKEITKKYFYPVFKKIYGNMTIEIGDRKHLKKYFSFNLPEKRDEFTKYVYDMKKKGTIVVKEGYGAGFSVNNGGLGGTSRGGFGGAANIGHGGNSMYTYEIKPLNHSLEQKPTTSLETENRVVSVGTKVTGLPLRSNATPDKKKITGIIRQIVQTDDSALKYYIVQDEATQNIIKMDPLTAQIIVSEPVEYYGEVENLPSAREKKMKAFKQNLVPESLQESFLKKETNTAMKLINSAERDGYIKGMEISANYIVDAAKKVAKEFDNIPDNEKLLFRDSLYRKFLKMIHKK